MALNFTLNTYFHVIAVLKGQGHVTVNKPVMSIDLLAILQKSLDRATFLYNFIHEAR